VVLVALALKQGWGGGVKYYDDDPLWPVLVLETPKGQVCWHLPMDEVPTNFPVWEGECQGNATTKKYERLDKLVKALLG
jgi:hypothetical protein